MNKWDVRTRCLKFEPGRGGGGLVVSVLAFYSDDPSSIPAEVHNFSVNCC